MLTSAITAALATCVACYPRLAQWPLRQHAIWYLVAVLFASTLVLWGFVFAWHTRYTNRPVIAKKIEFLEFVVTATIGIAIGSVLHFWFDPQIKSRMPTEFPDTPGQWVSMTLFSLGFQQLFLLFAPLAFFSRILRSGRLAVILTVFFGGLIILLKAQTATGTMPWVLASGFLTVRLLAGLLSIYFYLRGGIVLAYWWALVVQSRELFDFI